MSSLALEANEMDRLEVIRDRGENCLRCAARDSDRIVREISFSIRARRKFCTRALVTVRKRVYHLALAEKLPDILRKVTRGKIRVRL